MAVGFVLALICRDLAYFLGNPYMGAAGPAPAVCAHPAACSDIPILGHAVLPAGPHDLRQLPAHRPGLAVDLPHPARADAAGHRRAPGGGFRARRERQPACATCTPSSAARWSAWPVRLYSLSVKAGWKGTISGLDGIGWIALSITIFGGWNPLRAAFGAYLFALLQWLGLVLQPSPAAASPRRCCRWRPSR
ncbi:MAG: hypothetical protein M0C28_17330 [Candidatus Moduliflexus flocculans]|nr:hypothetical protein [Candidatus Moduliflexus flocculans]